MLRQSRAPCTETIEVMHRLGVAVRGGKPAQGSPGTGPSRVRDMTLAGLMDGDQKLIWASHYLSAMAKALLDDAELGMMKH